MSSFGEKSITYLQLAYKVEFIASHLHEVGIAQNDQVIVYLF
ncbi:hypothetical protein [Paenibacillus macerans]|nr:hypothetical protein [Paenibacillus macerans]